MNKNKVDMNGFFGRGTLQLYEVLNPLLAHCFGLTALICTIHMFSLSQSY